MKNPNFSYWFIAIILGSLINMGLFLFLPAIGRTAPPKKPQIIELDFLAWQQPAPQKTTPQKKVEKEKKPKPRPKPKPVKKKAKPLPLPKPKPKKTPQKPMPKPALSESVIPEKIKPKPAPIETPPIIEQKNTPTSRSDVISKAPLPTPIPIFKLTSLPRMLHRQTPVYPPAMKQEGKEATVKLEILLDIKGLVRKVVIKKSGGEAFDLAAIAAIKSSTFMPANINGKPVAVLMKIPVKFRLR